MTLPRQTADHVVRDTLRTKENLHDLLGSALPGEIVNFDFSRFEEVPREFFTGDWREREADLIFEVGYRVAGRTVPSVVGVMVEHQTDTDPHLPLRALFLLVNYWERRLRQWEQTARPRPDFRLPPVFCVVLYTAPEHVWGSNTNVRQLLGEPTALHQFCPDWGPQFWDLAARSADDLVAGPPWMQLMAVLRVAAEERPEFERVLTAVNRRLGPIADAQNARWSQLMRAIYAYSLFKRPAPEHPQIKQIMERENPARVEEVKAMEKTIAQAIEERSKLEQGRAVVRLFLDERFGPLPEAVTQRIDALDDLDRLSAAARLAARITKLDDFQP
jgi:hypothetical protein